MQFSGAHAEDQLSSIHMTFITLLTHLESPTSSRPKFGKLVWGVNIKVGLVCLLSVAFHGFTSEKNMEKHQSSGNLVTEIDSQHRQNEGKTK